MDNNAIVIWMIRFHLKVSIILIIIGNSHCISDTIATETGETVVLFCPTNPQDIKYVWQRQSTLLSEGFNIRTSFSSKLNLMRNNSYLSLQITNVTKEDEGEYCCHVKHTEHVTQHCTRVQILDTIEVEVKAVPSTTIHEHDKLALLCVFPKSHNRSTVIWMKEDKVISREQFLDFKSISREDDGIYQCLVNDNQGSGLDDIEISVLYAPDVSITQLENGSVLCQASGFPTNYTFLEWKHFSDTGNLLRIFPKSEILNINDIENVPAYTLNGRYQCAVENGIQDINGEKVQYAFKDLVLIGKPECIFESNKKAYGALGETIVLQTVVYTALNFTIEWLKANTRIPNSTRYQITTLKTKTSLDIHGVFTSIDTFNMSLRISDLTEEDLNILYRLEVFNNLYNTTCTKELLIGEIPETPVSFSAIPYQTGIQVAWLPGFDGGHAQTFRVRYRVGLQTDWKTSSELKGDRNVLNIFKLPEGIDIYVYMFAVNAVGRSRSTNTIHIRTPKTGLSKREKINYSVFGAVSGTFICVLITVIITRRCRRKSSRFKVDTSNTTNASPRRTSAISLDRTDYAGYEIINEDEMLQLAMINPVSLSINASPLLESSDVSDHDSFASEKIEENGKNLYWEPITNTKKENLTLSMDTADQNTNESMPLNVTKERESLSTGVCGGADDNDDDDDNDTSAAFNPVAVVGDPADNDHGEEKGRDEDKEDGKGKAKISTSMDGYLNPYGQITIAETEYLNSYSCIISPGTNDKSPCSTDSVHMQPDTND